MNKTVYASQDYVTAADSKILESVKAYIQENPNEILPSSIPNLTAAAVGQMAVVKEVDENNQPISWEAANLPEAINGISASHSWEGTVLTIMSASGTSSADLKGQQGETGPKGDPGETGPKGDQGETGPKGDPGETGPKGNDGHTPEKGVDYFTETDKEELVNAVLAALPTWEGGSY